MVLRDFLNADGNAELIAITEGVSIEYTFQGQDQCQTGTHQCTQNAICTFANQGFGDPGYQCSCPPGFQNQSLPNETRSYVFDCVGMNSRIDTNHKMLF